MEQIDFDQIFNGQHYQIVSRVNPLSEDGILSMATLYLINGQEYSERDWDLCMMSDKRAEAAAETATTADN